MKKYIKIFAIVFLVTFSAILSHLDVSAGSVNLSFKGNDTVRVNDTITLTVAASDISGLTNGLATAQGDLVFDNAYLEYVSFKAVSSILSVSYGAKTKRFVALGMGGEYITSSDDLFTLTFKAKQVGTTTLNMKDVIIGDTKAIMHSSNVLEKQIQIVGAEETPPVSNTDKTPTKKPNTTPSSTQPVDSTKNSDNTLKSLIVNNFKMSPAFSPDTLTYDVVVSTDTSKLDLSYITNNEKATVTVEGNSNFKNGDKNTVKVIVIAEDGSARTYTLNVTKSSEVVSNRLILLNVKEGSLENNFDSDTYQYSITVPRGTKKLTIDAIPEREDCKVEIMGDKSIGKGDSVVLIKLTSKNGDYSYYRLNVKQSNSFKLFGIDIKYIIIFIILLILIITIWLLLLFLKRKKDEEEELKDQIQEQYGINVRKEEDDLYDDIVTKEEIIGAIEENNPKKLEMLLTQEEANQLKNELRNSEEGQNPYDDVVTKEEIIGAIADKDADKLQMLLTQEEANKMKEKLKDIRPKE